METKKALDNSIVEHEEVGMKLWYDSFGHAFVGQSWDQYGNLIHIHFNNYDPKVLMGENGWSSIRADAEIFLINPTYFQQHRIAELQCPDGELYPVCEGLQYPTIPE